jgi:hypothetical protein
MIKPYLNLPLLTLQAPCPTFTMCATRRSPLCFVHTLAIMLRTLRTLDSGAISLIKWENASQKVNAYRVKSLALKRLQLKHLHPCRRVRVRVR